MRQFNILKDTKGWLTMYERVVRFRHMRNQHEVKQGAKIPDLRKEHGYNKAARDSLCGFSEDSVEGGTRERVGIEKRRNPASSKPEVVN